MQDGSVRQQWDSRHFGMVVKDVDQTLKYYSDLGLGPFEVREPSFPVRLRGNPVTFTLKMGFPIGGNTQVEVIEPKENASVHADTLAARGEGGQHMAFFVNDLSAVAENFHRVGIDYIFRGTTADGLIQFAYMDTAKVGGVILELIQRVPTLEDTPKLEPRMSQLKHVGVIVRDIEKVVEFYTSLGLGPFNIREFDFPELLIHGKPGRMKLKIAFAANWRLPMELIQPLEGGDVYEETLATKGEGIQHVACHVTNLSGEIQRMKSLGIQTIFENERFAYFDTREIGGLITEMVQVNP